MGTNRQRPFAMPQFVIEIPQTRARHLDFSLEKDGVFKVRTVPEIQQFLAELGNDFHFICRRNRNRVASKE